MHSQQVLLLIEGTYPWYRGGVSEWVHQYLSYFDDLTFHIVQVATDQYLNAELDDALYQVPDYVDSFLRIPPPELSKDWLQEAQRWKDMCIHEIQHAVEAADLIHIANTGFAGWLGKELAQSSSKPLMLTEHALYWKEVEMGAVALECGYKIPDQQKGQQQFVNMFRSMAEEIYRHADQVVSVSKCNISHQKKMGAQNVKYVPNGIPEGWLTTNGDKPTKPMTVGWIGRCAQMKNPLKFFEVINAFNCQAEQKVEFLMLCCDANEPELAGEVQRKSKRYPNLRLVWNRSTEEFIDQMDTLCITSHNESQPLILFEALARNVLPIGWEAGDVTDSYGLIKNREVSPKSMAASVLELYGSPIRWKNFLDKKTAVLAENHTWSRIFEQYSDIFNSFLKPA
jgi:glycosyltransferase involved in cell wall biosynthesis